MNKEKLRENIDFLLSKECNLSSYAAYTAVEIDSYICGNDIGFNAGRTLIDYIRKYLNLQSTTEGGYLDSCLLVTLNDAISSSKIAEPKRDVQSFLRQTEDILSCLEKVVSSNGTAPDGKYNLKCLRDFCLSLSDCAIRQEYPYIKLWKEKETESQLCLA